MNFSLHSFFLFVELRFLENTSNLIFPNNFGHESLELEGKSVIRSFSSILSIVPEKRYSLRRGSQETSQLSQSAAVSTTPMKTKSVKAGKWDSISQ